MLEKSKAKLQELINIAYPDMLKQGVPAVGEGVFPSCFYHRESDNKRCFVGMMGKIDTARFLPQVGAISQKQLTRTEFQEHLNLNDYEIIDDQDFVKALIQFQWVHDCFPGSWDFVVADDHSVIVTDKILNITKTTPWIDAFIKRFAFICKHYELEIPNA